MKRQRQCALGLALAMSLSGCGPAKTGATANDETGICFRRLEAVNGTNQLVSRYETIIVKQSSSIEKDIVRVEAVSGDQGPLRNPHTVPFVWHHATLSDRAYDESKGPDCSALPSADPE